MLASVASPNRTEAKIAGCGCRNTPPIRAKQQYEDGNDANTLRGNPLFKLATGRAPLDTDNSLACGATHSRLEGALSSRDIYRMARALVLQFIAGYSSAPASITFDLDHT